MSKKKAIKKEDVKKEVVSKPVSRVFEGSDAKVLINIYSPGHDPKEFRITIPNITGGANLLHRSPEYIIVEVIKGLQTKYGGRVG